MISGTDLRASRIGLGTWAIGGWMWGGTDEVDAIRTIHAALDAGINLIDTAPVYGFGRAEEIVGRALAESGRRQDVILATKAGLEWTARQEIYRNSSSHRIRKEIEDSLRRLRTDVIDLYQVHWPDTKVLIDETAHVLQELRREGKIRAIGVSNYSPAQMEVFRSAAPLHTSQPPYNLFERQIEADVLPYCRQNGITVLAYGAICRGLLSGTIELERRFGENDIRAIDPKFRRPLFDRFLRAVARLDAFARDRYSKRVIDLAVRWLLDQPGMSIALWGARRPEQLGPVQEIFGWNTNGDDRREIDAILAEEVGEAIAPDFMAPPQ